MSAHPTIMAMGQTVKSFFTAGVAGNADSLDDETDPYFVELLSFFAFLDPDDNSWNCSVLTLVRSRRTAKIQKTTGGN